ncbi:hypothetical protein P389DRAFT_187755 [Cystobasidium minutum MCA 4210]|uniref:uncharacterized protein n=1 Tax=Cystobasidium minutum MCA 4210 TaxID=1397322 RepID=UPI0034D01B2D|eukprot:jgi/Rhomi1/187755/estExt_fgenesh1_pg.C_1_t30124
MAGTQVDQQPDGHHHHPRQSACYLCSVAFSTDNIRKTDYGSRRATLYMIPRRYHRGLVEDNWFTRQQCKDAFLHVCCLCKGAVERFFTELERVQYLSNPVFMQWALKQIGWTIVRRERNRNASMKHGLELLDTFDANTEACQAFRRTWLSIHPVYPAPLPYPIGLQEGIEEPDFYEMEEENVDESESGSDEEGEEDAELSGSGSEFEEDHHGEDNHDDDQDASDLDQLDHQDDFPMDQPVEEGSSSNDSDDVAATLIASTPSTSKAVIPRHPCNDHLAAKASSKRAHAEAFSPRLDAKLKAIKALLQNSALASRTTLSTSKTTRSISQITRRASPSLKSTSSRREKVGITLPRRGANCTTVSKRLKRLRKSSRRSRDIAAMKLKDLNGKWRNVMKRWMYWSRGWKNMMRTKMSSLIASLIWRTWIKTLKSLLSIAPRKSALLVLLLLRQKDNSSISASQDLIIRKHPTMTNNSMETMMMLMMMMMMMTRLRPLRGRSRTTPRQPSNKQIPEAPTHKQALHNFLLPRFDNALF